MGLSGQIERPKKKGYQEGDPAAGTHGFSGLTILNL
jgi:hypothetical protein